jgi:transcriptional regulator with XRE-family HTH domain
VDCETSKFIRKRLKDLRKASGLTQERFAELAGISYKYYQEVEAGRKTELRISTIEKMAKAYHLKVYQLLSPEHPKVKQRLT